MLKAVTTAICLATFLAVLGIETGRTIGEVEQDFLSAIADQISAALD